MTTYTPRDDNAATARCASYSKSRDRYCLAYGRYACRDPQCAHHACGLHVNRNDAGIFCPRCGGPVRVRKD